MEDEIKRHREEKKHSEEIFRKIDKTREHSIDATKKLIAAEKQVEQAEKERQSTDRALEETEKRVADTEKEIARTRRDVTATKKPGPERDDKKKSESSR